MSSSPLAQQAGEAIAPASSRFLTGLRGSQLSARREELLSAERARSGYFWEVQATPEANGAASIYDLVLNGEDGRCTLFLKIAEAIKVAAPATQARANQCLHKLSPRMRLVIQLARQSLNAAALQRATATRLLDVLNLALQLQAGDTGYRTRAPNQLLKKMGFQERFTKDEALQSHAFFQESMRIAHAAGLRLCLCIDYAERWLNVRGSASARLRVCHTLHELQQSMQKYQHAFLMVGDQSILQDEVFRSAELFRILETIRTEEPAPAGTIVRMPVRDSVAPERLHEAAALGTSAKGALRAAEAVALGFDPNSYERFQLPRGTWVGRLDFKIFGQSRNLLCYFTDVATGRRYVLSAWIRIELRSRMYCARDGVIDFSQPATEGLVYDLETNRTRAGGPAWNKAQLKKLTES
jgi:hypothetical protein